MTEQEKYADFCQFMLDRHPNMTEGKLLEVYQAITGEPKVLSAMEWKIGQDLQKKIDDFNWELNSTPAICNPFAK